MNENKNKKNFKYAAGMLLFGLNNNNLMVLLGEDSYGMLSDFGGRCEMFDASEVDTASRECYEETCGIIEDQFTMKEICKNSEYIKSRTFYKKPYYMFLSTINFDTNYPNLFYKATNFLKTSKNIDNIQSFLEKQNLKWVFWNDVKTIKVPLRNMFKNTIINNLENIELFIKKSLFKDLRYLI
tara:strand:+ start:555 stop:1103 length:549 start_codon:yes stop_codon:yes gene_type:complete